MSIGREPGPTHLDLVAEQMRAEQARHDAKVEAARRQLLGRPGVQAEYDRFRPRIEALTDPAAVALFILASDELARRKIT